MSSKNQGPGLLIIDVQKGFNDEKWGNRNNPDAEENISRLLQTWRKRKYPIIHIQHDSTNPNSPLRPNQIGNEIKDEVKPNDDEPVFRKTVNSAFIGTNLKKYLEENEIDTLVVTGITTNHCVSTSTRMGGNYGFNMILVEDATACFEMKYKGKTFDAETVHTLALVNLNEEFAKIKTTDEVLNSL